MASVTSGLGKGVFSPRPHRYTFPGRTNFRSREPFHGLNRKSGWEVSSCAPDDSRSLWELSEAGPGAHFLPVIDAERHLVSVVHEQPRDCKADRPRRIRREGPKDKSPHDKEVGRDLSDGFHGLPIVEGLGAETPEEAPGRCNDGVPVFCLSWGLRSRGAPTGLGIGTGRRWRHSVRSGAGRGVCGGNGRPAGGAETCALRIAAAALRAERHRELLLFFRVVLRPLRDVPDLEKKCVHPLSIRAVPR
jgi:hypothetical protein